MKKNTKRGVLVTAIIISLAMVFGIFAACLPNSGGPRMPGILNNPPTNPVEMENRLVDNGWQDVDKTDIEELLQQQPCECDPCLCDPCPCRPSWNIAFYTQFGITAIVRANRRAGNRNENTTITYHQSIAFAQLFEAHRRIELDDRETSIHWDCGYTITRTGSIVVVWEWATTGNGGEEPDGWLCKNCGFMGPYRGCACPAPIPCRNCAREDCDCVFCDECEQYHTACWCGPCGYFPCDCIFCTLCHEYGVNCTCCDTCDRLELDCECCPCGSHWWQENHFCSNCGYFCWGCNQWGADCKCGPCGSYPCDCPVICNSCGEPEADCKCGPCGNYPCDCPVICNSCGEPEADCKCGPCGSYPCDCPVGIDVDEIAARFRNSANWMIISDIVANGERTLATVGIAGPALMQSFTLVVFIARPGDAQIFYDTGVAQGLPGVIFGISGNISWFGSAGGIDFAGLPR